MLEFGVIALGLLLFGWGLANFKKDGKKNKVKFNVFDIIINGFGSGLGMMFSGIVFAMVGIVMFIA